MALGRRGSLALGRFVLAAGGVGLIGLAGLVGGLVELLELILPGPGLIGNALLPGRRLLEPGELGVEVALDLVELLGEARPQVRRVLGRGIGLRLVGLRSFGLRLLGLGLLGLGSSASGSSAPWASARRRPA